MDAEGPADAADVATPLEDAVDAADDGAEDSAAVLDLGVPEVNADAAENDVNESDSSDSTERDSATQDVVASDAEDGGEADGAADVERDAPDADVRVDVDALPEVAEDVDAADSDAAADAVDTGDAGDVPDVPPESRSDGSPCVADVQCGGGTCLVGDEFLDGYCTTSDCRNFEDCTGTEAANRCWFATDQCVQVCERNVDCREGYICADWRFGQGRCWPPVGVPPLIAEADGGIDIQCGYVPADDYSVNLQFYISESTTSFMVVPFGRDLGETVPLRLFPPGLDPIELPQDTSSRLDAWRIFRWYNPLVFPHTPSTAEELVPGEWGMTVESLAREVCFYVVEEQATGTSFDVQITLVGAGGRRAAGAVDDEELQQMVVELRGVFEHTGVDVGEVVFLDASPEVVDAYRIVRTREDAYRLFSTTASQDVDDVSDLRIDVFLVDDVSLLGTVAFGTSGGLPGPVGLWGSPASGLVVSAEYLSSGRGGASGPEFTGVLMAHEIGHFLGLRHTTDDSGRTYDDLGDTPACAERDWPGRCLDRENLMFNLFVPNQTTLTAGQAFQMLANPLTN